MKLFNKFSSSEKLKKELQTLAANGFIAYKRRDFETASICFYQYLTKKPISKFPEMDKSDDIMYLNLGNAQQYSGKISEAIISFNQCIKKTPDFGGAYLMRAVCHYKLGEIELAQKDWFKASQLGEKHAQKPFETINQFV